MNKYKKLTVNTIIVSIGSLGSKLLSVLLVSFHSYMLGREEYSASSIIAQTIFLLIPIASLGIEEAVLRFQMEKAYTKEQIYSVGVKTILTGNAIMLLLSPLLMLIPDIKGNLPGLYLCIFAGGFRALNQQFIRARGLLKLYTFDGIMTTVNLLIANILFIGVFKWGVTGFVLSTAVSDILSSLFLITIAGNHKYIKMRKIPKGLSGKMLRYCIPLIPTFILWWIVSASDLYMVKYFLGPEENGLYSMAYKIPTLISIVSTIFYQAWQLSAISEFDSDDARRFYGTVFNAYCSLMYVGSAGITLMLIPLTKILLSDEFFSSYKYAPILIIAVLMSCFCQFLSSIYAAAKKTKNSLWTSFIAAATNIILNLILIPRYGVHGAAFATMASYFVCFVVRIIDTRKIIRYKINVGKLLLNFIVLGIVCFWFAAENDNYILMLIAGFVFTCAFNISEISDTIKKVLHN